MIERTFAVKQISRLAGLPFWPSVKEAQDELVNSLQRTARSEAHAKTAIDELVRSDRCPTPDDVIRTTWSLLTDQEQHTCQQCGGSGWVHTVQIHHGLPYDFSAACRCRVPPPTVDPAPKRKSIEKAR